MGGEINAARRSSAASYLEDCRDAFSEFLGAKLLTAESVPCVILADGPVGGALTADLGPLSGIAA